jgi:preprotein translocase subunit SecA
LRALRYRLRRDGFTRALLDECFALYPPALPAQALAAGRRLVAGGIVELADADARRHALGLAALARAVAGERVHVLTANDAAAKSVAEALAPVCAPLGLGVACLGREDRGAARRALYAAQVLCAPHREVGLDYLREGIRLGKRGGRLRRRLEPLASRESLAPLGELQCALVDDAELVLLDDAQAPLAITAQSDPAHERLVYEQALELARTLAETSDFTVVDGDIRLTPAASRRLERLVAPLGGLWSARNRREELVGWALEALHFRQRGADYRVENDRVVFPPPEPGAEEPGPDELELRKLVEVKEGCRLSARADVLARLSVPAFFARYASLAGVCADARGLDPDFWTLYSLKTSSAGAPPERVEPVPHVYLTAEMKRAALLERARAGGVIFAIRSRASAQELAEALKAAGLEAPIIALPLLQRPPAGLEGRELVVAELPQAARHAAQAARSLGASACTLALSLEDEPVLQALPLPWQALARAAARRRQELPARWAQRVVRRAQRTLEVALRLARQELKARDRVLGDLLAVSGPRE